MKRCLSMCMAVILLLTCIFAGSPMVHASKKANISRAIAIVFDNSGSMYGETNKSWCRATYAMEVFASMLNKGDTLLIYPMNPIEVGGKEYTMDNPFRLTDAAQAASIRDIYTPRASLTPVESVDSAANGLQAVKADKKYMIVLTDGRTFHLDNVELSEKDTKRQLDSRFEKLAGSSMTVMYLGTGNNVAMPETPNSEYFTKKQAKNSSDVLSALTDMCNQIFGRDTLPESYVSGNSVRFDISMSKLIVFVQGENVSDLKVVGPSGPIGQQVGSSSTKYGTAGCGNKPFTSDTSLQGMMVTYTDCASGDYTIEYTGTASSVEVYYEPAADLAFVFTDAAGNNVDPNALYEGDYKVSFGMKDAKTGKLIESELLGKTKYQGSYSVNGTEVPITADGYSGEVPISLKMGDKFDANLTVTYLSGYTISKDTTDFGWPEGGIQVAARPAGDLRLEITGGEELYSLQNLAEGAPYIAKVYYQGNQLTGDELASVFPLRWDPTTSNAEIKNELKDDHIVLTMHYKDPDKPQDTVCGECTVAIAAYYRAQGSDEAMTETSLTYNIKDDFSPLQLEVQVPQDYIVISELGESQPITIKLRLEGAKLTAEDFSSVAVTADCGGIAYELTPDEQGSAYVLKLQSTEGIEEGDYSITITGQHTDRIGRVTEVDETVVITLSTMPLWLKWAISLLLLLILILVIWRILHIRVLPKYMHTTRKLSSMNFDGDDVTISTNFMAEVKKKGVKVQGQFAGKRFGLLMDVKAGPESYLYKSAKRKSALVKVTSVKKFGTVKILEAMIGSAKYVADENTGKLVPALPNQKPFLLTHGMMVKYSGTIQDAGVDKDFEITSKLDFKKQ